MSNLKDQEVNSHWTKVAKRVLEGKTIVEVRYLNDEEMEMMCKAYALFINFRSTTQFRAWKFVFFFVFRQSLVSFFQF